MKTINKNDLHNRISKLEKENFVLKEKLKQCKSIAETNNLQIDKTSIFPQFFNTLKDFFWILDEQGNILFVNDYVVNRLDYTREELYKMNVLLVHPPERREEALQIVNEVLAGKTEFCPIPLMTKDGYFIPVETRALKGKWNNNIQTTINTHQIAIQGSTMIARAQLQRS